MIAVDSLVQWRIKDGRIAQGRVVEIVENGEIDGLAIALVATPDEPIAKIEVWRDGVPTDAIVGHKLSRLEAIEKLEADYALSTPTQSAAYLLPNKRQSVSLRIPDKDELSKVRDFFPSEADMDLINQYVPLGLPPLESYQVRTAYFIVADNLLNRSLGKWTQNELNQIRDLLPGLPFMLDHDWNEVGKTQGLIYSSGVMQLEPQRQVLDRVGYGKENSKVVQKEGGYYATVAAVSFPADSPVIDRLRFGHFGAVSLGGFTYEDHWCPLCDTSFTDSACPHGIPMPEYGLLASNDEAIAPYYIRKNLTDAGELSNVWCGNLPGAGVIRSGSIK